MLDYVVWKDEYDFGIPEIDKQHRGIARHINALYEAIKIGGDKNEIQEALKKMIEFTRVHFKYEEELAAKHEYADLAVLKEEHIALINELNEKSRNFTMTGKDLLPDLLPFYREWLINHTQGTDKRYLPLIKG